MGETPIRKWSRPGKKHTAKKPAGGQERVAPEEGVKRNHPGEENGVGVEKPSKNNGGIARGGGLK